MDSEKWKAVKQVVSAALEAAVDGRRAIFAAVDDLEVRVEAERIVDAHDQADGFIEQPVIFARNMRADIDPVIGTTIGDFRILEHLGSGGMGAVYLAERATSEYTQRVALKLIKRGMDSEAILKRFARERRILASLNHPNIAAMIDGGISADGRSYFVMEYVEGVPLNDYRAAMNPGLSEILAIFQQICSAVDHAHRNLVIHRDLKPSNIIVSPDGVPKLLDFGIAKIIDDDGESAETTIQARALTPEYAAPEQILGKAVSTSADVYSLGVILFELLCGRRPFDLKGRSLDEIAVLVSEAEPRNPSSVVVIGNVDTTVATDAKIAQTTNPSARSLAGDLDNIVLKALRKDPADRYLSVNLLAQDISLYLQGMPVTARPQTAKYRLGKFVRRHRVAVVAALLVALSLIAGSSIATWQAIVARRERVRAEKRFNDVRKIASAVIFEYHDKIVNLPDSTELGEKMLSDTVIYLDQLSQEGTDDIELQLELARAYKKVGDIQGGSANANRTKFDSAAESYLKALRLTESAAEKRPDDIAILNQLGRIYRDLAGIERIKGKLDDSVLHFQQAAKIYRQMLVIVPDDVKAVQGLAWSQINIATQREEPHQVEESLLICREAVALLERLAESNPENSDYKSHLPGAYDALADVMMAIPDRRTEALGVYRKTLALLEQFLVQTPNDINLIERIATTHAYIADAHHLTGEPDLALASYRESVSRFDRLVEMDKKNDYALFLRSYVKTLFGRFLAERKDATQAIAVLREPLAALPTRVANDPEEAVADMLLGIAHHAYGDAMLLSNDCAVAAEHLKSSLTVYTKYADRVVIPRISARKLSEEATASLGRCSP